MAAELEVVAVLLVVVDGRLIVAAATSWRSDGVRERSEVDVGKVEYWLLVEVLAILLLVVKVVAVGTGEEGLVPTATSSPPAKCKRKIINNGTINNQ